MICINTPITRFSYPSPSTTSDALSLLPEQGGGKLIPLEVETAATLIEILQQVETLTGIAQNLQLVSITSFDSEPPDMTAMTAEERESVLSDTKALVPEDVLAAAKEYIKPGNAGIDFKLKDLRPGDIVRYLKSSVHQWDEDRVLKEAAAAGPWGDTELDFIGDGGNLYDLTVGDDTSYAKGGYAGSEFVRFADPPAPEATVQAIVARVQRSIVESEAAVVPVFGALVRLLKVKALIPKLNKADVQKNQRMILARQGKSGGYLTEKSGGYLTSNDQKQDDGNDADGTLTLLLRTRHTRSILDHVMTLDIKDRPTTLHTRASNFMAAIGSIQRPHTPAMRISNQLGLSKDYELVVRTSEEFLDRVKSIGGIIIRDHFKAIKDRVFKPADMGGIAGGTSPQVVHE